MSESESLSNTAAMMPRDPMFIMGSFGLQSSAEGCPSPLRAQRLDHGAHGPRPSRDSAGSERGGANGLWRQRPVVLPSDWPSDAR